MDSDYHDPISQTVPDAMHTVKVVMEHLLYLIVGREDSVKVRQAEIELQRFNLTCTSAPVAPASKQRKNELGSAYKQGRDQVGRSACMFYNLSLAYRFHSSCLFF